MIKLSIAALTGIIFASPTVEPIPLHHDFGVVSGGKEVAWVSGGKLFIADPRSAILVLLKNELSREAKDGSCKNRIFNTAPRKNDIVIGRHLEFDDDPQPDSHGHTL